MARKALTAEDDAKLIFGTIFSLRRIVRQLGGDEDSFLSYRTGEYKMHYFETPTQLKFVMLTDTRVGNMRTVLHQIWATLYVEYVVKNPLSPNEHPGGVGVSNQLFEGGLESFIVSTRGLLENLRASADNCSEFYLHASTMKYQPHDMTLPKSQGETLSLASKRHAGQPETPALHLATGARKHRNTTISDAIAFPPVA